MVACRKFGRSAEGELVSFSGRLAWNGRDRNLRVEIPGRKIDASREKFRDRTLRRTGRPIPVTVEIGPQFSGKGSEFTGESVNFGRQAGLTIWLDGRNLLGNPAN